MNVNDYVKFYFAKGLNILPANAKEKMPCIPSWKKFQTYKVTKDMIDEWLKVGMFNNINLCLGSISGVYEIDIDVPNAPVGLVTLGIEDKVWVCESSVGKLKIFFAAGSELPTKMDSKVNKEGGHVELRGNNHLSVLPPSVHHTGCQYKWLNDVEAVNLVPLNGRELYKNIVERLRAEFLFQEERKFEEQVPYNGTGVRDIFTRSAQRGDLWNGAAGHSFRLAYCAELINNGYSDAQIHAFFKAHDLKSGEDYSYNITQEKISELRRKNMRTWKLCTLKEQCPELIQQ
jgi:hypothetical protein